MEGAQGGLRERTKTFALRVIRLVAALPREPRCDVLGKQLLRCATSVGANYRAACRARSPSEFRAKLGIVEEEADESSYWIELLVESGMMKPESVQGLLDEANELVAMIVASIRTSRKNHPRK
ncbi:MAG: four helix bundle protein [Planctomycetales bacterium]